MDPTGLVWRLASDRRIISLDKTMMPVCELLRKMTIEKGLVDMEVEYHITTPKVYPAQEPWIVRGWLSNEL